MSDVNERLTVLHARGAITGFEKKSVNKKAVWSIKANGETFDLQGTAAAEGFALGAETALATVGSRGRKPNPVRDAIERDGRVEVPVPDDEKKARSVRNGIFSAAYSLGLKGRFGVRKEGDVFIGELKE